MAGRDKTLEHFSQHLLDNEIIVADVFGTYEGKILGKDALRNGILVATNHRVVFYTKKLFGYELETFYYNRISSIQRGKSFFLGDIVTIVTTGNTASLKWIKAGETGVFVDYVDKKISNQ